MARPIKDNADYFSHDADMRDDPKIKALRRKFKIAGYGIWCMLLEAITDSDNFRLEINLDILAGDFDVEPEFLNDVIIYCTDLGLLQTDDMCITLWSKTLDNRFASLLSKRKRDRGELSVTETKETKVIAIESTHSKVKESKVKESLEAKYYHSSQEAFEDISNNFKETEPHRNILTNRGWRSAEKKDTDALLFHFLECQADLDTGKSNVKSHFKKWLNKISLTELQTLSKQINERLQTKVP